MKFSVKDREQAALTLERWIEEFPVRGTPLGGFSRSPSQVLDLARRAFHACCRHDRPWTEDARQAAKLIREGWCPGDPVD